MDVLIVPAPHCSPGRCDVPQPGQPRHPRPQAGEGGGRGAGGQVCCHVTWHSVTHDTLHMTGPPPSSSPWSPRSSSSRRSPTASPSAASPWLRWPWWPRPCRRSTAGSAPSRRGSMKNLTQLNADLLWIVSRLFVVWLYKRSNTNSIFNFYPQMSTNLL